jgi:NAD(P)-dependent dehydrogenase (short-subunit alcohol dehydrogenase family)
MRALLITGAAGGLGGEVVKRLEREYRLITPSRKELDVASDTSVGDAFAAAGELYGLVHLVGGWAGGKVAETSLETWSQMLSLNTTAAFLTMREAARTMKGPARILAVSSIATLNITAGSAAYTVAKSALNALVQSLAGELRGSGVTVNAVLPDGMATPAMVAGGADASRLVDPADVAETIAWLLSDAASAVTGALVPVPGK